MEVYSYFLYYLLLDIIVCKNIQDDPQNEDNFIYKKPILKNTIIENKNLENSESLPNKQFLTNNIKKKEPTLTIHLNFS